MSYPQFVEVLVLLAASAARRLRHLYPDVAGEPAPSPTKRDPRNSDSLADSSAHNGRSPFESESAGEERRVGVGGGAKEKTGNTVRAALKLRNGRFVQKVRVVRSSLIGLLDEVRSTTFIGKRGHLRGLVQAFFSPP